MGKELQNKASISTPEIKGEGADGVLHIKAYACAFGNIDSYGDIIAPTACDAFLKSVDADRLKLCYQHNANEVIGVITDKGTDDKGMWIEADILPTQTGRDVQTLIKAGAINEFSIGYYADDAHGEVKDGQEVRVLDAITIIEVSPVTRAANPKAVLLSAKSEDFRQGIKGIPTEDLEQMRDTISAEIFARYIHNLTN